MLKTTQTSIDRVPEITRSTTVNDLLGFAIGGGYNPTGQPDTSGEATATPAVARCAKAYDQAFHAARATKLGDFAAGIAGEKAFRRAMPTLIGRENIRDFIACVAHGMLLNAIPSADGARLLYAAQIAHAASPAPDASPAPRQPGRPKLQQAETTHPESS